MKLKLYHYWRSSSSWRVRWALSHKGFSPEKLEYVPIHLLKGEHESAENLARNPLGAVPSLEIQDAASEHPSKILIQSVAILEWIDENILGPALYPNLPLERAYTRELVEIINADTHPLQNLSAQERHSSDPTERKAWAKYFIEEGLEAYSKRLIYFESLGLRGKDDGTSLGSGFTAADLTLVPQLYNALRYDVDLTRWPRFLRIWEHSKTLRSYQASEPSQFEPS